MYLRRDPFQKAFPAFRKLVVAPWAKLPAQGLQPGLLRPCLAILLLLSLFPLLPVHPGAGVRAPVGSYPNVFAIDASLERTKFPDKLGTSRQLEVLAA